MLFWDIKGFKFSEPKKPIDAQFFIPYWDFITALGSNIPCAIMIWQDISGFMTVPTAGLALQTSIRIPNSFSTLALFTFLFLYPLCFLLLPGLASINIKCLRSSVPSGNETGPWSTSKKKNRHDPVLIKGPQFWSCLSFVSSLCPARTGCTSCVLLLFSETKIDHETNI